jgi:hypothetical protein
MSFTLALLGVLIIGGRAGISRVVENRDWIWILLLTLGTAISSAFASLVLSVPGTERSPAQRAAPLILVTGWLVGLSVLLSSGGSPLSRLLAFPVHILCIVEIAAFAAIPAWALLDMIRRAAPLRPAWSAALAALAATALGAGATQILCPIYDPAHHIVGHFGPMVALAAGITLAKKRRVSSWLGVAM